jgi:nitroreductase
MSETTGDALELIMRRRSIREYAKRPVGQEQITRLLQAAMAAPSGRDARPWEFVVVTDAERRRRLSQTHQFSAMAAAAPVVFVVCGRPDVSPYWVEDCSAATENLLLEATSLGLGGVWVGIYPGEAREAHVRAVVDLPEEVRPLCLVPVGYPAEPLPARTRFEAARVHHNHFGQAMPAT